MQYIIIIFGILGFKRTWNFERLVWGHTSKRKRPLGNIKDFNVTNHPGSLSKHIYLPRHGGTFTELKHVGLRGHKFLTTFTKQCQTVPPFSTL